MSKPDAGPTWSTRTPRVLMRELNRRCQSYSKSHEAFVAAVALKKPTFPLKQSIRLKKAEDDLRSTLDEMRRAGVEISVAARGKKTK